MNGRRVRRDLLGIIATTGAPPRFPAMLHKTQPSIWKSDSASDDDVTAFVFNEEDFTYSFWEAQCMGDVILAAHFISTTRREPLERSVHFVSVDAGALRELAVKYAQEDEFSKPVCRGVRRIHYNFTLSEQSSLQVVGLMRGSLLGISKRSLMQANEALMAAHCEQFEGAEKCACDVAGLPE